MLAAILTCGLTVTTMTSCSDDDDSGKPNPPIVETLTGEWLAFANRTGEDLDDNEVEYVLLSFDEDGVMTQNVYVGNTTEPIRYWERMHRHGIYTVDEAARTLTYESLSKDPITVKYSFDNEHLTFSSYNEEKELSLTFHRPSKAEKKLLSVYDLSLWGDDYVGKWLKRSVADGVTTYVLLDFTEDSGLKTIRYVVDGDQCTRSEITQVYNEAEDGEEEYDSVLEIHSPTNYMESEFYWWKVDGNTLTLGKIEEEEEDALTYHALTLAEAELLAELDKKSN